MGGWLIDIQGEVLHSCEKGTLSVSPGDLDVRQNCHADRWWCLTLWWSLSGVDVVPGLDERSSWFGRASSR